MLQCGTAAGLVLAHHGWRGEGGGPLEWKPGQRQASFRSGDVLPGARQKLQLVKSSLELCSSLCFRQGNFTNSEYSFNNN